MRYDLIINDMTWSYSRLTSFSECRYKWLLTYLYRDERGNPLKRQSGFFAEYGSYMHSIMQMYLSGELKREELSIFYISHFAENVRAKAPNIKIFQTYYQQGFFYLDNIAFPNRKIIGVEEPINFQFANKPWIGYIDVISSDGKLILTDHKSRTLKPRTKRSKPTKSDIELDEYFRQLYVYSAGVKDKYGCYPDALEFNCFRSQTIIQEPFQKKRLDEVEVWAENEIERITCNDNWIATPDYWRCHYLCDVCKECEFYKMS